MFVLLVGYATVKSSFYAIATIRKRIERTQLKEVETKYNMYMHMHMHSYKTVVATKKAVKTIPVKASMSSLEEEESSENDLVTKSDATENTATESTATENTATENTATESTATENTATESTATENIATQNTATSTQAPLTFEQIEQNCSNGGEFTEEYKQYINSTIPKEGVLNKYDGTIRNRWGNKETYYNLPMNGVVKIMRNYGYSQSSYPYWVRADGAKMLGPYVMIAANLKTYHRCTVVNISLGKAIVADTGDFAYQNVYQFDVATSW